MSDIQTWHERAMAHPDHQNGMVSEGMIRARMCEEIADLRAEVKRLHQAHQTACEGGDLLREEIERLTRELDEARAEVARQAAEIWTLMRAWRSDDEARAYIQARRREAKP